MTEADVETWPLFSREKVWVQGQTGHKVLPTDELVWVQEFVGSAALTWGTGVGARKGQITVVPTQINRYKCRRRLDPSRPGSRNRRKRWLSIRHR